MILHVNPNRMELLRLRKRLVLARRGHKLLQDKLEDMMRRFMEALKMMERARAAFDEKSGSILADLLYCRIVTSRGDFLDAVSKTQAHVAIAVSEKRIANLKVPHLRLDGLKIEKHYDLFKVSAQFDVAIAKAPDYIDSLLSLAQLLKTLDILSYEIERTRRRVNALEYRFIPSIEETIRYITQKLSEFERTNLVRLMRVKDVVRSR